MTSPRRIVALYLDDAISQADDSKLVDDFIRKWVRGPKMRPVIDQLATMLERFDLRTRAIWQATTSEPPRVKLAWLSTMVSLVEAYSTLISAAGNTNMAHRLWAVVEEYKKLPRSKPFSSSLIDENTARMVRDNLDALDAAAGKKVYSLLETIRDLRGDILQDAEELGLGAKVEHKLKNLQGTWWKVWPTQLPAAAESLLRRMPAEHWVPVPARGAEPNSYLRGKSLTEFLTEFTKPSSLEMRGLEQLAEQIANTANFLSLARKWAPEGRGALDELEADLSYVVDRLQVLMQSLPATAVQGAVLGWLMTADGFLRDALRASRSTQVPRSAGQLRAAHELFQKLEGELRKLVNLGLRVNSFVTEILKRAEEELQSPVENQLHHILGDADLREVNRILDQAMEDHLADVPLLDPMR